MSTTTTKCKYEHLDLSTGDILLFENSTHDTWYESLYAWLIKKFTSSTYTHAAMVLKDPVWIKPELKGLYIYESGLEPTPDAEDGVKKFGVQLTPIDVALETGSPNVYVRRLLKGNECVTRDRLQEIHRITHNTLYDFFPIDLLNAAFHRQPDPRYQHTYAMFCSALVGFMCIKLKLMEEDVDFSEILPQDLSCHSTNKFVKWLSGIEYGEDTLLEF